MSGEIVKVASGETKVVGPDKEFIRRLLDALEDLQPSERRDGLIMDVVASAAFPMIVMGE